MRVGIKLRKRRRVTGANYFGKKHRLYRVGMRGGQMAWAESKHPRDARGRFR